MSETYTFMGVKGAKLPPGAERFIYSRGAELVYRNEAKRLLLSCMYLWDRGTLEGFARIMRDLWMEVRHHGLAEAIRDKSDDAFDIAATTYGNADEQFDIWTEIIQAAKGGEGGE